MVGARVATARAGAVLDGRCAQRHAARTGPSACLPADSAAMARVVALAEDELATGRGTERLMRVARTIADLDGSMSVEAVHLDEAAWYRSPATRAAEALAS